MSIHTSDSEFNNIDLATIWDAIKNSASNPGDIANNIWLSEVGNGGPTINYIVPAGFSFFITSMSGSCKNTIDAVPGFYSLVYNATKIISIMALGAESKTFDKVFPTPIKIPEGVNLTTDKNGILDGTMVITGYLKAN